MTAHPLPRPADPDFELDGFVAAFEAAAAADPHADPAAFVPPPDHPRYVEILAEVLRVDLELAWDRGERRRTAAYRTRFPVLASHPSVLRGVLREEARLSAVGDGDPDSRQLPSAIVPAVAGSDQMPGVGEVAAGFALEAELGRGAFGRVFLGRQPDLADRPVAIKVSAKFPGEWQTLARLQHAHIVPVYSVHRHGRFHVACMPYLGRTTLADVIGQWRASTVNAGGGATAPASGGEPPEPARPPAVAGPPVPDHPNRVGWVLTVGSELADALAHAHERGVLHRDIKPANVLLTDDGLPMLLDFNLAADVGEETTRDIGGTPRYMAPEQLVALATDRGAHSERSDVYALGLVLCELLSGRLPFDDPPGVRGDTLAELAAVRSRPLDRARLPAGISPAVASILSAALAPDPARRYPSAAVLREDLERQLAHRPLAFAPERSVRERLAKWRHRHPRLSSWVTVTALAAVLVAGVVGGFLWRQRNYEVMAATNHLHRMSDVRDEVRARLSTRGGPKAEYAEVAAECEAVLSVLPAPTEPAWQMHPLVRPLALADRRTAVQLTTELRWLKAGADRLSGKSADDHELLEAARAADTSGVEFRRDELNDTAAVARKQLPAARAAARTESGRWAFWYRLGHLERRAGDLAAARAHFRLAADLDPDDDCPWSVYHLGATALDAKEWKAAVAAFDEFMARRDDVPEAYLNRAIARIHLNDLSGAIADLDRIEPHADTLPRFYFTRAEAKQRHGDAKGADADRSAGLKAEPTDAVSWNARGEAKLTLTPPDAKGALADFERAKTLDPDSPTTYQNLATVYGEHLNRPADAVKAWDEALLRFPGFALGLGGRAVYLARQGNRDDARRDADAAVLADPSALVCYQAACAYLLTAKTDADRRTGMGLLRRALRADPSWGAGMPIDPDLNSVWKSDEFRELVRAAGVIAAK